MKGDGRQKDWLMAEKWLSEALMVVVVDSLLAPGTVFPWFVSVS